ncbi:MAG: hydrolase [Clostridium sp.]|jgi:predicted hydrolase (HD superfamily)|nr:hydrolase [Clostridium sp.]
MHTNITRVQALALLQKYNQEPFHILHSLTVEGVMRYFAKESGYAQEVEYWGLVGLLHDVDFEQYPQEHCQKAPDLLAEIDAGEDLTHSVCSHGYGICSDVFPEHEMEKILFAADELTGLIGAAVKMRPSKSAIDLEVSSLKKKFKDKRFAAGCSREIISQGIERLGVSADEFFDKTIQAMRSCEAWVTSQMETLGYASV